MNTSHLQCNMISAKSQVTMINTLKLFQIYSFFLSITLNKMNQTFQLKYH